MRILATLACAAVLAVAIAQTPLAFLKAAVGVGSWLPVVQLVTTGLAAAYLAEYVYVDRQSSAPAVNEAEHGEDW